MGNPPLLLLKGKPSCPVSARPRNPPRNRQARHPDPGMGAVATTFMAGVEAIRRGISKPIGSLTQMGTIRLGKRTEGRSPLIKEFVPLAKLDDIVFGGWDLFPDDAYVAASKAGVLSQRAPRRGEGLPVDDQADDAGVRSGVRQEADRDARQDGQVEGRPGRAGPGRHQALQGRQRLRSAGDGVVRVDRGVSQPRRRARVAGGVREGAGARAIRRSRRHRSTPTRRSSAASRTRTARPT